MGVVARHVADREGIQSICDRSLGVRITVGELSDGVRHARRSPGFRGSGRRFSCWTGGRRQTRERKWPDHSRRREKSKMKVTASSLIRWSGLAALVAGLIFAAIQPIHAPDVVAPVNNGPLGKITPLKTVMCLLFLIGITGIYARQVKEAGWLGLAGFLLLIVCWWLQSAFVFAEAFIAPPLASTAAGFVDGYLGVSY